MAFESCPPDDNAAVVADELDKVKRFNDVLRAQLLLVIATTGQSAEQIAEHAHAVDRLAGQIERQHEEAGSRPDNRETPPHSPTVDVLAELGQRVVALMSCVQFQDITRQQVEHVSTALDALDRHMEALATRLRTPDAPLPSFASCLDDLYANYVMDQQRITHEQALQMPSPAREGSRKVELF